MVETFDLDMDARAWSREIGADPDRAREFYDLALSGDLAGLRGLLTAHGVAHRVNPRPVITGVTKSRSRSDKG